MAIKRCPNSKCKSKEMDDNYGKKFRLHNAMMKTSKEGGRPFLDGFRCSVCLNELAS